MYGTEAHKRFDVAFCTCAWVYEMSWSSGCNGHTCGSQKVELADRWFAGKSSSLCGPVWLWVKEPFWKRSEEAQHRCVNEPGHFVRCASVFLLMSPAIGENSVEKQGAHCSLILCLDVIFLIHPTLKSSLCLCSNSLSMLQFLFRLLFVDWVF